MALYHTCDYCGSNLDPGERCDCGKEKIYKPMSRPKPPIYTDTRRKPSVKVKPIKYATRHSALAGRYS